MTRHEYFKLFSDKLQLPGEAVAQLSEDYEVILKSDGILPIISEAEDMVLGGKEWDELSPMMAKISEGSGVGRYAVDFLFYMGASQALREKYAERGIPEEIFWESMSDLKYKLFECREVRGVWGTFVGFWFPGFYTLDRFKLGRMEYEIASFHSKESVTLGGHTIAPGDPVLNFHIPSAGPMPREVRLESYKLAYDFYPHLRREDGLTAFVCDSWLLYPDNKKILPPHLNTVDFLNDFHICSYRDKENFSDAWRVFGSYADGPVEQLPEDTTQRRAFKKWLLDGGVTGEGYGLFFFDGEKIVK